MRVTAAVFLVSALLADAGLAQTPAREELRARRATVPPKIDGVLDDELVVGRAAAPRSLDVVQPAARRT